MLSAFTILLLMSTSAATDATTAMRTVYDEAVRVGEESPRACIGGFCVGCNINLKHLVGSCTVTWPGGHCSGSCVGTYCTGTCDKEP